MHNKPHLYEEYSAFLDEYEKLGHIRQVQLPENDDSQIVYLPHHPVIREGSLTTHLRVVFNASSLTSNKTSLNSHLHIGPKLLTDLISIITRWRRHPYVYMADIEKMFRQILVDPRDCDYQRILWRLSNNQIIAFQLSTVTYGMSCAPFLANRVLKQLALDEGSAFPNAKEIIENAVYVDDVLFGAESLAEAKKLRNQVFNLLEKGEFHLRKWMSNSKALIEECPLGEHERAFEFSVTENAQLKVLGLHWDPVSDSFRFKVASITFDNLTKHNVLSLTAKLYTILSDS